MVYLGKLFEEEKFQGLRSPPTVADEDKNTKINKITFLLDFLPSSADVYFIFVSLLQLHPQPHPSHPHMQLLVASGYRQMMEWTTAARDIKAKGNILCKAHDYSGAAACYSRMLEMDKEKGGDAIMVRALITSPGWLHIPQPIVRETVYMMCEWRVLVPL